MDELPLPNELSCQNLVDFIGKIFERGLFSLHNFLIFGQKYWTYDLPRADRRWVACLSWRHDFDDLSILNDSNYKNLVAFFRKIIFWHLISSYNTWNSGEKWPKYDINHDHCMCRNSDWKSFSLFDFWQLFCLRSQLLNK